jgi:hypothetical protein
MLIVDAVPLITGSIFTFNEGRGIDIIGQFLPAVTCTDVFGNSMGDWIAPLEPLASSNGNLTADPRFCSVEPGAPNRFHLEDSSPLAAAGSGCGTLGAHPASCLAEDPVAGVPEFSAAVENVSAKPNPFNPQTTVSFELAQAQDVRVSIYGLDGRLIRVLGEGPHPAGSHNLVWKGKDHSGRTVGSGVYFVMVQGREDTRRLKVTLLK